MQHPTEHTLEQYVLDSPLLRDTKIEIDVHLQKCASCRELESRIRTYYGSVAEELRTNPNLGVKPQKGLVRANQSMDRFEDPFVANRSVPVRGWRGAVQYVRTNPVTAGISVFSMMALVVAGMLTARKPGTIEDRNPAYVSYETSPGAIVVRNKQDQEVWSIPIPTAIVTGIQQGAEWGIVRTGVVDIDGDGTNEVYSALSPLGEYNDRSGLVIFNSKKQVVKNFVLENEIIPYQGRIYRNRLGINNALVLKDPETSQPQFYLTATHSHSPMMLCRMDIQGNHVGEYWHFGHIANMYLFDVTGDLKPELILCGVNDVDDTSEVRAVVAVLDPEKLVGVQECSVTPGFGFRRSDAELMYIRFPRSDLDRAYEIAGGAFISNQDGNSIAISVNTVLPQDNRTYSFNYFFSKSLEPQGTRFGGDAVFLHNLLLQEGKVTGSINEQYLDNLTNAIEFWDGERWQGKPMRIKNPQ